MKLIIDSWNPQFAHLIAVYIAAEFGLNVIDYDYANNNSSSYHYNSKWIICKGPNNSHEYRKVCSDGFSPDLVICVDRLDTSSRLAKLELFYDDKLLAFSGDAFWVIENVRNAICEELNGR